MDLYTKLVNSMDDLSTMFSTRMQRYEDDLKSANGEAAPHKTISSLSREFTDFRSLVWKTLGALKTQLELLVVGLDRHEMASRAKVLLFHGLKDEENTKLPSSVMNIVRDKLKVTSIVVTDIVSCHFLGTDTSRPRSVLVRFGRRTLRNEVWHSKTKLKGTGITVSEFLTKPRHEVFMNARKHFGMKRCWTSDGKIVVQVTDKQRRKIESSVELRELMASFPVADSSPAIPLVVHSVNIQDKRPQRKTAK